MNKASFNFSFPPITCFHSIVQVPTYFHCESTKMTAQKSGMVRSTLLEKIDKLFAANVGEHIALPQLVVVGDQSSGKSSVLAGLTGLPFPRDSVLCTRFATQIIFQRSPQSKIAVSIIPAKNSTPEYHDRVKQWSKTDLQELTPESFAGIMTEVGRRWTS